MRAKLLFLTGLGIGYVLGARAGRKRYEQIKSAAQKLWETDVVQGRVSSAKQFTKDRLAAVPSAFLEGAKKFARPHPAERPLPSSPPPRE
jgi:hypothetical protein